PRAATISFWRLWDVAGGIYSRQKRRGEEEDVAETEGAFDPGGFGVGRDELVDDGVRVRGCRGVRVGWQARAGELLDDARAGEPDRRPVDRRPQVAQRPVGRERATRRRRSVGCQRQQALGTVGGRSA